MNGNILDIDNDKSLLRQLIEKEEIINLRELNIPETKIPKNFVVRKLKLKETNYIDQIADVVTEIIKKNKTEETINIFPIVYEAATNAYKHGNNKSPNKTTTIAYKHKNQKLELMIEDEGGIISSKAISFFIRHQENKQFEHKKTYYEFAQEPIKKGHAGLGTYIIHMHSEAVEYYKAETGGLGICITINSQ